MNLLQSINLESLQNYFLSKKDLIISYGIKIITAIVVLWIGLKIIKFLNKMISKKMESSNVDNTLKPFIINMITWALKIMLFISVAGMMGIQTTSFVAILGAAGLAVGLALQGSLGNFAGGALLLLFRPFKVGDLIEAQGLTGVVEEIQIFCTLLKTNTNRTIIIPNGPLAGGTIINHSKNGMVRCDIPFGISYGSDFEFVKSKLVNAMAAHPKVLKNPSVEIKIDKLDAGIIKLVALLYCESDDYWTVYWDSQEIINKTILSTDGIDYATPCTEVILKK